MKKSLYFVGKFVCFTFKFLTIYLVFIIFHIFSRRFIVVKYTHTLFHPVSGFMKQGRVPFKSLLPTTAESSP